MKVSEWENDHVPRRGRQRVLRVLSGGGRGPPSWLLWGREILVEQGNTSLWKGPELSLA